MFQGYFKSNMRSNKPPSSRCVLRAHGFFMFSSFLRNSKLRILPVIILQPRGGMGSLGGHIWLVTSSIRVQFTLSAWITLIRKNRVYMLLKKTSVETVGLSFGVRLHVGQHSTCEEARGRGDFNTNSVPWAGQLFGWKSEEWKLKTAAWQAKPKLPDF